MAREVDAGRCLNSPRGLGNLETVYGASQGVGPVSGSGGPSASGARNQRYEYLVGRLRSRQITMEEATELFTVMQAMLTRANELARTSAYRSPTPPPPAGAAPVAPPPPRGLTPSSSSDDLLLVGILAMGAGAGLLAALSQRMGATSPPSPSGNGRSPSSPAPR